MKVYTVEHREQYCEGPLDFDCTGAAVFSSVEKAEEWLRIQGHTWKTERLCWFVMFEEEVDPDPAKTMAFIEWIGVYDINGNKISEQPYENRSE